MIYKQINIHEIYLAGGCFWGVENYFSGIPGIISTETGYANGKEGPAIYERLSITGHAETVKVKYAISRISLEEILLHFFRIIDPISVNRQGFDYGSQYRTGIYYTDESDLPIIEKIYQYEEKIHGELAVEVLNLKNFTKAEDHHQKYLEKNPSGYCHIDPSLNEKPLFSEEYKNPDEEVMKEITGETSYYVMRFRRTEKPFSSEFNDKFEKGIYVDRLTGEPLFTSKDKFDGGCGWPSFSKPILSENVTFDNDFSHGMIRREVRSKSGDSHLGHVFKDGPEAMGGMRYCINGAALAFIPYSEMKEKGYGEYLIFC